MDRHKSLTSQGEKEEIIVNIVVAIHRPFDWLHWKVFSSFNHKVSSSTLPAMMLREKGMAKGREIKFSPPSPSTVWRQVLKYYLILIINNTTFLGQRGPLVLPLADQSADLRKSWIPS